MAAETVTEIPPETQEAQPEAVAAAVEPKAPAKKPRKPDAKANDAKADAKGGKGAKKAGKKGKDKEAVPDADGPNIAAHPRAARAVARAKSWGGLIGFVLAGYLSLPTNTVATAGLRALAAGVVCYVAVWAGAVFVWRRLVILEIKGREQQLVAGANAAARPRELPPSPSAERSRAGSSS